MHTLTSRNALATGRERLINPPERMNDLPKGPLRLLVRGFYARTGRKDSNLNLSNGAEGNWPRPRRFRQLDAAVSENSSRSPTREPLEPCTRVPSLILD